MTKIFSLIFIYILLTQDVLLYVDQRLPDSEQQLESAIYTFTRTAGTVTEDGNNVVFKPGILIFWEFQQRGLLQTVRITSIY